MPTFRHVEKYQFSDIKTVELGGLRRYVLESGEKYPSITSVLGAVEDKTWLESWRNALGPAKADAESKRCADRGTAIHLLTEKYLKNEEPDLDSASTLNAGLFRQIRPHLNKINNIYALEKAVYNKQLRIAGRCDCVAEYDGVLSVIDFKTSNQYKYRDMIEGYFLQATFYALAFNEMFEECVEDVVIIIAIEKGIVPLVFREKINKFVKPLLQKTKEFRKKHHVK